LSRNQKEWGTENIKVGTFLAQLKVREVKSGIATKLRSYIKKILYSNIALLIKMEEHELLKRKYLSF
jgi:hypothetical protein